LVAVSKSFIHYSSNLRYNRITSTRNQNEQSRRVSILAQEIIISWQM